MKNCLTTALIAFTALVLPLASTTIAASESNRKPPQVQRTTMFGATIEPVRRMRADGFEWEHEIQIALPASYRKSDKKYPVLWVTDGSFNFQPAVEIVNSTAKKYLPEMIVIGIGAPPEAIKEVQRRRVYDFSYHPVLGFEGFGGKLLDEQTEKVNETMKANGSAPQNLLGGAPRFLAFLTGKVRAELSRDYRMSEDHTLFGHSGGGMFCTYALLADPEAFDKFICSSPSIYAGNQEAFRMEERYAGTHKDMRAKVFFGAGEDEVLEGGWISAWGIVSSMTRMAEILKLRAYPSLALHVRIFPGEDHSVGMMSLRWGLRTLWEPQPEARR